MFRARFSVLIVLVLTLSILTLACESTDNAGNTEQPSRSTLVSSPTPEPLLAMSVGELHAEREANATRYDQTYKAKKVLVSGVVCRIESETLYLADSDAACAFSVEDARLEDLPINQLIAPSTGDPFAAICTVGNYILGTIFVKNCVVPDQPESTGSPAAGTTGPASQPAPQVTPNPTEAPPPAESQTPSATPEPTATQPPAPTPTPKPSLDPGTYQVGVDIEPGIYAGMAGGDVFGSCYWARLGGASGEFSDIIANENESGQFYVEIAATDKFFNVHCEITPLNLWPEAESNVAQISQGTYIIGRDVGAGTYVGEAGTGVFDSCYWARLSGVSGQFDDIIANDNALGRFFVTVLDSDFALRTGCPLTKVQT